MLIFRISKEVVDLQICRVSIVHVQKMRSTKKIIYYDIALYAIFMMYTVCSTVNELALEMSGTPML